MSYTIITGDFDVHHDRDVVKELPRIDDNGDIEYVMTIETDRDMTGLNVKPIGNAAAFSAYMSQNGFAD